MRIDAPEAILAFWFGELDADGRADQAHASRWWRSDPAFDQEIRDHFADEHAAVVGGHRDRWLPSPRGRLAYVIVLDQFSRNLFRDSEDMFAYDERALDAALGGIERGCDRLVGADERSFYDLPLMHSELLPIQDRCIALFTALRDAETGASRDRAAYSLDFAQRHRDIVARFGRFPHRNAILGRVSTAEETAFLEQPGSRF
jgi:uncharacterized protein (DUF924 family)